MGTKERHIKVVISNLRLLVVALLAPFTTGPKLAI